MNILGIETSCDETASAVVRDGTIILSNIIASQMEMHARWGGVVPEVASRQHTLAIIPTVQQAMAESGAEWQDIDGVAVTCGPGLAGSLLVGVNVAKSIAFAHNLPLIGVNHLEGHMYANWLGGAVPAFPLLCLIVSGGHSDLVLMKDHGDYVMLGRTRDDAAGEAFDKAARILELGYPGGPAVDRAAADHAPSLKLPIAWLKGTHDFSFSGVKTALLRLVETGVVARASEPVGDKAPAGVAAASFQDAIVEVLVAKTVEAAIEVEAKHVLLAGGVAANRRLRERLTRRSPVPVLIPSPVLCTDNAAMIAACGYFRLRRGSTDDLSLDISAALKLA